MALQIPNKALMEQQCHHAAVGSIRDSAGL